MELFSKSLEDIVLIKRGFFDDNIKELENAQKINNDYVKEQKRNICKNCLGKIGSQVDIKNHNVNYHICEVCGHLNGLHEDSSNFTNKLYSEDGGSNYSADYITDYMERVDKIYTPKADFLINSMAEIKENEQKLSVTDFGCGGGHFVHALHKQKIQAKGIDISQDLIDLAANAYRSQFRDKAEHPFSQNKSETELLDSLLRCNSLVASFIGVLEHLREPNEFLKAFTKSNVEYIFFSVPLFSLTVYIENIFDNVYPRHLSGGHTHLYTHRSIDYLLQKHGLEICSSWHFGVDSMDLKRSMMIKLKNNELSDKAFSLFEDQFYSTDIMNDIQIVLDKHKVASEIHIIARKKI